jgi:hypothetical protein
VLYPWGCRPSDGAKGITLCVLAIQALSGSSAITTDTKSLSRDCQLGEVKVRFFGDSIAIAYGAENKIDKANDGKDTKRCLVWTDTWLKR